MQVSHLLALSNGDVVVVNSNHPYIPVFRLKLRKWVHFCNIPLRIKLWSYFDTIHESSDNKLVIWYHEKLYLWWGDTHTLTHYYIFPDSYTKLVLGISASNLGIGLLFGEVKHVCAHPDTKEIFLLNKAQYYFTWVPQHSNEPVFYLTGQPRTMACVVSKANNLWYSSAIESSFVAAISTIPNWKTFRLDQVPWNSVRKPLWIHNKFLIGKSGSESSILTCLNLVTGKLLHNKDESASSSEKLGELYKVDSSHLLEILSSKIRLWNVSCEGKFTVKKVWNMYAAPPYLFLPNGDILSVLGDKGISKFSSRRCELLHKLHTLDDQMEIYIQAKPFLCRVLLNCLVELVLDFIVSRERRQFNEQQNLIHTPIKIN